MMRILVMLMLSFLIVPSACAENVARFRILSTQRMDGNEDKRSNHYAVVVECKNAGDTLSGQFRDRVFDDIVTDPAKVKAYFERRCARYVKDVLEYQAPSSVSIDVLNTEQVVANRIVQGRVDPVQVAVGANVDATITVEMLTGVRTTLSTGISNWRSEDAAVASINANTGRVRGQAVGETVIHADIPGGSVSGRVVVIP